MPYKKYFLFLFVLISLKFLVLLLWTSWKERSQAIQAPAIQVPSGKTVIIDGKITPLEWSDAKVLSVGDSVQVFLKASGEYLLIAVEAAPAENIYIDLYTKNGTTVRDFHASAKLGQRLSNNGSWTDWNWGNNKGWVANVSRINSIENKTFFNENSREFQIEKSLFKNNEALLFITMGIMNSSNDSDKKIPADANITEPSKWILIKWLK
jgi:hypothetical protein